MKIISRIEPKQAGESFEDHTPELLRRIYRNRGIFKACELGLHLSLLPKPETMQGIDTAIQLLTRVVMQQQRLTIVGDFDADGATSTALAMHFFRNCGFCVDYLVPNRFEFGYGLSPEIVDEAIRLQNPDIIITVDNGISSIEGVSLANKKGVAVIITDHHLPGKQLPEAEAIVNPNQAECRFIGKNIAGVGVIFYVLSALRSHLREQQYFKERNITEPNMGDYLDLVALGTVADVVSLDHINRILVQQGLLRIRAGKTRPGIQALLEIAKKKASYVTASDFGFALAPRINAAGRMDDMSIGIECLLAENINDARGLAVTLDDFNRDRKSVEQTMKDEAQVIIAAMHWDKEDNQASKGSLPWGLCVFDENWHQGVIGILASRIKEQYHRPVIAFALADDGETIKGSARSIEGFHIRDALDAIASENPGLLDKFGGHAMAAGLSLKADQREYFFHKFDAQVKKRLNSSALESILSCDGKLDVIDFSLVTAKQIREAGPWGQHFPEPLFEGVFELIQVKILKQQHAKLVVEIANSQEVVDAIAFFVDADLLASLQQGSKIKLAYHLSVNEFRGQENLQLLVEYMELL